METKLEILRRSADTEQASITHWRSVICTAVAEDDIARIDNAAVHLTRWIGLAKTTAQLLEAAEKTDAAQREKAEREESERPRREAEERYREREERDELDLY